MHKKIHEMIDKFLEKRGELKDLDRFAEVGKTDIRDLYEIIGAIIEAKYDKDVDGDLPVQARLVDRNKARFLSLTTIPYKTKSGKASLPLTKYYECIINEALHGIREIVDPTK